MAMNQEWIEWARQLQVIAQNGLHYAGDPYQRAAFTQVREIAAQMLAGPARLDPAVVGALFAAQTGHATPKVDVRGVVFRDDLILLVREVADGLWTLPGGWADPGEPPSQATVREVYEEAGYRTRATKLLMLHDRNRRNYPPHPFHIYKIFFLCVLESPAQPDPAWQSAHQETDGVAWYRADAVPPLSTGRVTEAQIARLFEHHRHPDWPADFD
ncbi:MAG TPA: NUDIX hydrolase [Chloroflexia bacterium]|nr:NUDIX hydrolase [Chloroflexia bacterium]